VCLQTWQNNDVKTKTATAKTKAKTIGTNKVTQTSGREAPLDQEAKKSRGLAYNTVTTMRYRCDCEKKLLMFRRSCVVQYVRACRDTLEELTGNAVAMSVMCDTVTTMFDVPGQVTRRRSPRS